MRMILCALTAMLGAPAPVLAQQGQASNSIGMEFVRIQPGSMIVGRFDPPYPKPPSAEQRAAAVTRRVDSSAMAPVLVKLADQNGNAQLSAAEWHSAADNLFTAITLGSPEVLRPEFGNRWNVALGLPAYGQPGFTDPPNTAARAAGPRIFRLADENRNAALTRAEFTAVFAVWFLSWNSGQDDVLVADEVRAGLNAALPTPPPAPELSADDYATIEAEAKASFRPGFLVGMPSAYDIGRYEVTQGQWKAVMGTNPSVFPRDKRVPDADNHPVDNVTWDQAQEFVRKLNALENTNAYRLPTEFEWEYAARGGATDDISWTNIREQAHMGLGRFRETQAVGKLVPNSWGLYDTLGNVWEWVQDYYNEQLFAEPSPPRTGTVHVLKGSGFLGDVKNATYFTHAAGPANGYDVGFRIVRAAGGSQ